MATTASVADVPAPKARQMITVRISGDLHTRIKDAAYVSGLSLNRFCLEAIIVAVHRAEMEAEAATMITTAPRPPESQPRCEIRCGDYPHIEVENGHFVVHADADSTIVEDELGPLDKARAQYWLAVVQERAGKHQQQGV